MKKFALIPLFFASAIAHAQPYINVGYGIGFVNSDEARTFVGGPTVKPEGSEAALGGSVGYRFENNFGLEFSVNYNEVDDSAFGGRTLPTVDNQYTESEVEYEAKLRAISFAIKPTYFYNFNEKLALKTSIGMTVTNYKSESYKETESERYVGLEDYDLPTVREQAMSESKTAVGVVAGLGLEYNVWNRIIIGVNGSYSYDSVSNGGLLQGTVGYQF